jgi:hypothetical protein
MVWVLEFHEERHGIGCVEFVVHSGIPRCRQFAGCLFSYLHELQHWAKYCLV